MIIIIKKAGVFSRLSLFKIFTSTLRSNNYFCHWKTINK